MPLRCPKMYSRIFGFHRFVWWPKWTPASRSSFIVTAVKSSLLQVPPCATRRTPLALGELEPGARPALSVLFSLLHARIARENPRLLQFRPQRRLELHERPGDAVPHRARLPRLAPARHVDQDVELVVRLGQDQGLPHDALEGVVREPLVLTETHDKFEERKSTRLNS